MRGVIFVITPWTARAPKKTLRLSCFHDLKFGLAGYDQGFNHKQNAIFLQFVNFNCCDFKAVDGAVNDSASLSVPVPPIRRLNLSNLTPAP